MKPAIFAIAGLVLTDDERAFFRDAEPAGYILFGRNIGDADQVRALTDELRALHARDDVAILVDQEGGRVARLAQPEWPAFPPGEAFDRLYAKAPASAIEAARFNALALGRVLSDLGITVDCLPLLDVRRAGAHDVIGDRALGSEPMQVAALGRATLDGLREGGVVGVVKHMPGHGRAGVDSHKALPVVTASDEELADDLAPFSALRDAPMAMTAHVVYTAWDADRCATLSPRVIDEIIRGRIGFEGLLMSDDIDMEALDGAIPDRSRAALAAGCDVVLNCWARMDDMVGIANAIDDISPLSSARLDAAMARISGKRDPRPYAELAAQRDTLLAIA